MQKYVDKYGVNVCSSPKLNQATIRPILTHGVKFTTVGTRRDFASYLKLRYTSYKYMLQFCLLHEIN